jgi:hypothetical protein
MLPVSTNRGNELLRLIADGVRNREISRYLTSSESTVEKRGISNRAQAIAYFFQLRTSSQNDIQITEIFRNKKKDKTHNINGINTSINYLSFSNFHLFAVRGLNPLLLWRVLKCYPF